MTSMVKHKVSFRSLVGMGSRMEVEFFEAIIIEVISTISTVANLSRVTRGPAGAIGICSPILGMSAFSWFLRVAILLLKNERNSSQPRVLGIDGSVAVWLFVSLATVWKRNLALFLFASIKLE